MFRETETKSDSQLMGMFKDLKRGEEETETEARWLEGGAGQDKAFSKLMMNAWLGTPRGHGQAADGRSPGFTKEGC